MVDLVVLTCYYLEYIWFWKQRQQLYAVTVFDVEGIILLWLATTAILGPVKRRTTSVILEDLVIVIRTPVSFRALRVRRIVNIHAAKYFQTLAK